MKKGLALFILVAGTLAAIAPYNPFGDPVVHPNPLYVLPGVAVGIVGCLLVAFAIKPAEPKARKIALGTIVVLILLGGMGYVLP